MLIRLGNFRLKILNIQFFITKKRSGAASFIKYLFYVVILNK